MNIYISSKISGLEKEVWQNNFKQAELDVKGKFVCNDIRVINPSKFQPEINNPDWCDYMVECIQIVRDNADVLYLFGDWHKSAGAWVEMIVALRYGKKVFIESGFFKGIIFKFVKRMVGKV